ncbi:MULTISPECIES: phage terminase small subunit [Mycobacteroides]|uniref:phage terminase small subunit n=1 Tax=Mycobacteroides TaxID=670516 RepID=UPI000715F465|nr:MULTISPECIES: hypothetical protein [Mycobacteroides]DAZ90237.1 TPA_asm: terminase, small subunit [Mycobacterium phage prophiFSIL01-1]KRQ31361.1 hypothetical protein AOT86_01765 [Mycobacteroides sp. H072]KRQ35881.1 hypothetical protein AOT84_15345 [Mycobacteroides sp. H002]KRQ50580.1 hypothetical protein AOT85_13885 [Mycobacteroides sp. H054]KRQ72659.1 hypothetical protein AOT83_04640 [Mycobacteroides sp. H001]
MAGIGPRPKDPDRLAGHGARRGRDNVMRIIPAKPVEQPPLPQFDLEVSVEGEIVAQRFKWPARTVEWWQMWKESPLSKEFTSTDWSELLDTAVLHARYWTGDVKVAAELRLRVAKFGATPEDRARLRIQFAAANEADKKASQPSGKSDGGSKGRYGPLGSTG